MCAVLQENTTLVGHSLAAGPWRKAMGSRAAGVATAALGAVLLLLLLGGDDEAMAQTQVEAPQFSPHGSDQPYFVRSVTIFITCATPGAVIRYTVDGSTPTEASPVLGSGSGLYWTQLGTTQVQARAWDPAGVLQPSTVVQETYTVVEVCAPPVMTPPGGLFTHSVTVVLTTETEGATIYYTLDGTIPTRDGGGTTASVPSGGTVHLTHIGTTTRIRAVAAADQMGNSPLVEGSYEIAERVATPTFDPAAPSEPFTTSASIQVACATPGATIHYTLDGSRPNVHDATVPADGRILIDQIGRFIINTLAVKTGMANSFISTLTIRVWERVQAPVFDPVPALHEVYYESVNVHVSSATPSARIWCTVDGSWPVPLLDNDDGSDNDNDDAHDHDDPGSSTFELTGEHKHIRLDQLGDVTLRAMATYVNMTPSATTSASYHISLPRFVEFPVANPAADGDTDDDDLAADPDRVAPNYTVQVVEKRLTGHYPWHRVRGRLLTVHEPLRHFSVSAPFYGCGTVPSRVSTTARMFEPAQTVLDESDVNWDSEEVPFPNASVFQRHYAAAVDVYEARWDGYGCAAATNAGFFNTSSFACYGSMVSQGSVVQVSNRHNVNFGIRDGKYVIGYLNVDEVESAQESFDELITGVLWLVRDGVNYLAQSLQEEDLSAQETGTDFATTRSARTAIGHNAQGQLMMLQIEGETFVRGASLDEMANMLVELGFINAINLDGGGSANMVQEHVLISDPSWHCHDDPSNIFRCEKPVTSILCIHAAAPPVLRMQQVQTWAPTAAPTLAPTAALDVDNTTTTGNGTLPANQTDFDADVQQTLYNFEMATFVLGVVAAVSLGVNVAMCSNREPKRPSGLLVTTADTHAPGTYGKSGGGGGGGGGSRMGRMKRFLLGRRGGGGKAGRGAKGNLDPEYEQHDGEDVVDAYNSDEVHINEYGEVVGRSPFHRRQTVEMAQRGGREHCDGDDAEYGGDDYYYDEDDDDGEYNDDDEVVVGFDHHHQQQQQQQQYLQQQQKHRHPGHGVDNVHSVDDGDEYEEEDYEEEEYVQKHSGGEHPHHKNAKRREPQPLKFEQYSGVTGGDTSFSADRSRTSSGAEESASYHSDPSSANVDKRRLQQVRKASTADNKRKGRKKKGKRSGGGGDTRQAQRERAGSDEADRRSPAVASVLGRFLPGALQRRKDARGQEFVALSTQEPEDGTDADLDTVRTSYADEEDLDAFYEEEDDSAYLQEQARRRKREKASRTRRGRARRTAAAEQQDGAEERESRSSSAADAGAGSSS